MVPDDCLSARKYNQERHTSNLRIPYYVKKTFEQDFGRQSIPQLDREVENDFINDLRYKCLHEKQQSLILECNLAAGTGPIEPDLIV